jgi:hypothetical protein
MAKSLYDYVEVQRRIEDVKEQSELISASVGARASAFSRCVRFIGS